METFKPSLSEVAVDLGEGHAKLIEKYKLAFESALPVGYMIVSDVQAFKVGRSSDFKFKDSDGKSVIAANCELMHVWHGNFNLGISMQKSVTPSDIYDLSEVMQLMVSVDLKILGDFEVVK